MSEPGTPDPAAARRKRRLNDVAEALRRLHKQLVEEARLEHEQAVGAAVGTGELLDLLMGHEGFQWLRPLSRAMVALDELLDLPAPTEAHVRAVRARFEALVTDEAEEPFGSRYREMLQRSVAVVSAHAEVRIALRPL